MNKEVTAQLLEANLSFLQSFEPATHTEWSGATGRISWLRQEIPVLRFAPTGMTNLGLHVNEGLLEILNFS